jgi:hypothetical protein
LHEVERDSERVTDGDLDRIRVAHRDDDLTRVSRDESLDRRRKSSLKLNERFTTRESEPRGMALHRLPLWQLCKLFQLCTRPLAKVTLEQTSFDLDALAEVLCDRCSGLPRPFKWRRINRSDRPDLRDPLRYRGRFGESLLGQVQPDGSPGQDAARRWRGSVANETDDRG